MPYATEITAAEAGVNNPYGTFTDIRFGSNALTKGYVVGGFSGSAATNYAGRVAFATNTAASLGAVLSSARQHQCGMSDGAYIFVEGGTAVTCDKITVATDAFAAHSDGNLSNASYYGTFSFPASAGYIHNGSYARKIPFSTGVAANATVVPFACTYPNGATDGIAIGYAAGSNNGTATTAKFSVATEAWGAASDMALGKGLAACASYGAL